jgi:type I restriction enzyme S subunit
MIATTEISSEAAEESKPQLPDGWRWGKLGEVCEFLDSRRIPINDSERTRRIANKKQSELFPYYGANGQVGWIDDYLFDEPLILLAEDGGNFGSTQRPIAYAVSGRYWVNNHAHVLKPRDELIDFDYCLQAIRIRPDVAQLVSGSTRAKLNQEIAASIPVPLPPLAEQKRIAGILKEQMASAERLRQILTDQLDAINKLPAALLRRAFNGEL